MVTGSFDHKVKACLLRASRPLAILLTVFFGVSFLPGRIEGLYNQDWSICGCDGVDEYAEFHQGWMNFHFYGSQDGRTPSWTMGTYVEAPDGAVEIRYRSRKPGEEGQLFARAYPHFLVTRFVSAESGKSRWKWKVPVMPRLGRRLEQAQMLDFIYMENGSRKIIYDHDGKIIEDTFRPRKPKPAPPEPVKNRAGRRY